MTERKIIHLNQNYSLRVEFDLETKEIDFTALWRSTGQKIEDDGLNLMGLIDEYGTCGDHIEVIEESMEILLNVRNWINSLDIEALIAEHAECEAEERRAETREDMERESE